MDLFNEFVSYIADHPAEVWGDIAVHVQLSSLALVIAILIAVPLGVVSLVVPWSTSPVLFLGNLGRVVPSLAVLAICLPIFGVGDTTALIALTALAVLPILLNVRIGLSQVDPAVLDAARGIGLRQGQILSRIQFPLAMPIILGGIRTAAVFVIASATLTAFIGSGGLGDPILQGIATMDNALLLVGAIPVAILAIVAELLLSWVERVATPRGIRTS
ncbi:MAG: ABC transporter permease [Lacisediminihabitans sp.]